MVVNELSVRIGGFAGQGINTVALALARLCSRAGLDVFVNLEYPSNIKGEHNYAQVVVSEKPVGSQTRQTDLLLAVDAKTIVMHLRDIAAGGVLIYDSAALEVSPVDVGLKIDKIDRDDIGVIDLPLLQLAKDAGGDKRMVNMIGLGAVLGLVQLGFEELVSLVREQLARLGEDVIRRNLEAARRAYDLTSGSHAAAFGHRLKRRASAERMLLTGNDAIALGAMPGIP